MVITFFLEIKHKMTAIDKHNISLSNKKLNISLSNKDLQF